MNKNKKSKLGTYSNDGLGMGLIDIEFSDEQLKEATKILDEDLSEIRRDFMEQLLRLDSFIKSDIGAIPRTEDFILWVFDKKKIDQTGKKLPKITDKEIIDFAKDYTEKLRNYTNYSNSDKFLKLNYGSNNHEVIKLIYDNLNPEKIETNYSDFEKIFGNYEITNKIRWKGSETEFVNLFTQIKFENLNLYSTLTRYFLNKNNNPFSAKQLSVSKSKSTEIEYKGKSFVENIISQIKNHIKS